MGWLYCTPLGAERDVQLRVAIAYTDLIISRLSYAVSAWDRLLSTQQISKIDAFLSRARPFGFSCTAATFSELLDDAECSLFKRTIRRILVIVCTICCLLT